MSMTKGRDEAVIPVGCVLLDRRLLLTAGAMVCLNNGIATSLAFAEGDDLPAKGDHLVAGDGGAKSPPLTVDSVTIGGDIVTAIAVTPAGAAKSDSRFAKVILFRFDPKDLDPTSKSMSVDGVVAFSAICTHQGCELNAWDPSTDVLRCFCHGSEFLPEKSGQVAHGPAVKQLPMLPLQKGDGGKLMVSDGFTAQPGPPQKTRL